MNQTQPDHAAERAAHVLIGGLSLILLVIGQLALYTLPNGLGLGLLLSAAAVALFVWAGARQPPRWLVALVARARLSRRGLLIGFAVSLSLIATGAEVAFELTDKTNYLPALILWAGSIVAYVSAFLPGQRPPWREWLTTHRNEIVLVGCVMAAAAIVRFYQLGNIPRVINGDEGLIGQFALETDVNPYANPFSLFENIGGVYLQSIGLSIRLLGRTPFALRLAPAIGGLLAIPALYLLGRQLFGRRVALFAAAMLAVAHGHVHFSRTVAVTYIQGTLLIPLELYFFISGLEKRSAWRAAVGGAILALHYNVYVSAQIVAAMLVVYVVVAAILGRPLVRDAWQQIVVFWFGVILVALPQIIYNVRNFDAYLTRLNADGTIQSGWLAAEAALTGKSQALILFERVAHASLSLNYYPALDFYGAAIPMLDIVTSSLFLLGLGYALWRTRDYRYLLLNGYFWSITVAIGMFSIPPSADSYRMLAALPAAILMAALGLKRLLGLLSSSGEVRSIARVALPLAVLAAIGVLNLRAYYFDFALQCRYGEGLGTRFASYLGNYLRTLDRETTVYLLNNEELRYGTHLSVDFLSDNLPVTNVPGPAADIRPAANTTVIAVPNRAEELRDWSRDHPGGALKTEYDCQNLMLIAYRLP